MKKDYKDTNNPARQLRMSIMLLIIALVSIVGATVAWFSVSHDGRVNSMNIEITTGKDMKFDLDAHGSIDQYLETLSFDQIAARIESTKGFNPKKIPLVPVTTSNCDVFTYQDGSVVSDTQGDYLTFTLHFIADTSLVVHMTTNNEDDKSGTIITSKNSQLRNAMRISFTVDGQSYIYDPGMGDTSTTSGNVKTFGLPENSTDYNDNNAMFSLVEGQDKAVVVHIWLEGNDENCKDNIKGSDYQIAMKFKGTDEHNNPIDEVNNADNTNKSKPFNTKSEVEDDSLWGRFVKMLKSIVNKHKSKKFNS